MDRGAWIVVGVALLLGCTGTVRPSFMIPMGTGPESTTAPVTNPIETQTYRPRAEDRAPVSKSVDKTAEWAATLAGAIGFVLGGAWPALAVEFDETSWIESLAKPESESEPEPESEPPDAEPASRPDQSPFAP